MIPQDVFGTSPKSGPLKKSPDRGRRRTVEDPILEYSEDHNRLPGHDSPAMEFQRAWRMLDRTAALILARLQVVPPARANSVRRIYIAQELIKQETRATSTVRHAKTASIPGDHAPRAVSSRLLV